MKLQELFESFKSVLSYPVSDEDLAKMVVALWLLEAEGIDNLPGAKRALFLHSNYAASIKWIDNEIKYRPELRSRYDAQLSAIKILSARSSAAEGAAARETLVQSTIESLKKISSTLSSVK
jgi:hypothetical protein